MTLCSPINLCHVCFEGKPGTACKQGVARQHTVPLLRSTSVESESPGSRAGKPEAPLDESGCLARWIIARSGLDAGVYRHQPLKRRLPACLRMLKVPSAAAAQRLLDRRPELLPPAVSALLIGVTEFFRDGDVFDAVRGEVLPDLAQRRGPLRVWSAACATGEELYSLAILLAETGLLGGSFLLGTDCRADAVEQARTAAYPANALRAITPDLCKKYFEAIPKLPSPARGRGARAP